jgi:NADPH-dependent curcumin reductase CurA
VRNQQILMAARPVGLPQPSDFSLVETETPPVNDGEVLLETLYLSVDPYMRGRMSEAKSYAAPMQVGDVMIGGTVARVLESKSPKFTPGDAVEAYTGWQRYAVTPAKGLRKLHRSLPLSTALGVCGMPGLTAYFGLLDVCQPKAGETLVVSGAAGAVGSCVGQIGKILGCRVVGVAGTDDKVAWLTNDLGFDAAFNYRRHPEPFKTLKEHCPGGIDCYFDNVGGPLTDAVFGLINANARIAICGQISQYNNTKPELGPRLLSTVLVRTATVRGFLVFQYLDRAAEGYEKLGAWVKEGKIKYQETIVDGLENAPQAFIGLLQGVNTGKMLVRVSAE